MRCLGDWQGVGTPLHAVYAITRSSMADLYARHVQVRQDDGPDQLKRGTRVTLHLKEDAHELADDKKLGDLIKQYSEFIQFPIR